MKGKYVAAQKSMTETGQGMDDEVALLATGHQKTIDGYGKFEFNHNLLLIRLELMLFLFSQSEDDLPMVLGIQSSVWEVKQLHRGSPIQRSG